MKKISALKTVFLIFLGINMLSTFCVAQEINFENTTYYVRGTGNSLISSGSTLGQFNFSSADRGTAPIFHDGIYFPAKDCFAKNIWIRVRHIAEDPNGTNVGINIGQTVSTPCRSPIMIGGWAGFLYDFEIHRDSFLTGNKVDVLGALYPTSITVASLETLSGDCGSSEWLNFVIQNSGSTGWSLNSVNFTGINPNSKPAFSDTLAVYTTGGCYPPDGFSYTFPTGADSISAINGNSSGYSEFKMSAGGVSHFIYGYEFIGGGGGYQGMSMAFGTAPTLDVTVQGIACYGGNEGEINVTADGIAPFTYKWNTNLTTNNISGLTAGSYSITVTDQNGCVSFFDSTLSTPSAINEISISGDTITATTGGATYQWIDCTIHTVLSGETSSSYIPVNQHSHAVIVSKDGCTDTSDCADFSGVISHATRGNNIFIYPNPAQDVVTVIINGSGKEAMIELRDIMGRLIYVQPVNGEKIIPLKLAGAEGIYTLSVKTREGSTVRKILKQ